MTKELRLRNEMTALISEADYQRVSTYEWYAFCTRGRWYVATNTETGRVYLHRLVADAPKGMDVDHINGNGLDNRRENLRVCTRAENLRNRGRQADNTSGYKGVTWNKHARRWAAQIKLNRENHFAGYFDTAEEAAIAYNHGACRSRGSTSGYLMIGSRRRGLMTRRRYRFTATRPS